MGICRIFFVAAVALVPTIADASTSSIPKPFLGEWSADLSRCGKGTDESFLYIEPRKVSFWESTGPVRAAVVRGRELALILELSGEGEVWLSATQFELSADGNALIWEADSGTQLVRFRCPDSQERPNNSFKPNPLRGSA